MNSDNAGKGATNPERQRDALASSEKRAADQQPGSYKEKETAEKVVHIPPAGPGKKPIRGLDSK